MMTDNEKRELLICAIRESASSFFYFERFYFAGLRVNRGKKNLTSILSVMEPSINVFCENIQNYYTLNKYNNSAKIKQFLSDKIFTHYLLLLKHPEHFEYLLSISNFIIIFYHDFFSAFEFMEKAISSSETTLLKFQKHKDYKDSDPLFLKSANA